MSYQIGLDTMFLREAPRLAHTEYCSNESLIRHVVGAEEPADGEDPDVTDEQMRQFYEAWQFDFLWRIDDGPVPWSERGRTTDMGHAVFLGDGRDKRQAKACPFRTVEEAWAFDAVEEYGLPDFEELVRYYENFYREGQAANPGQVFPIGYYKTIVSGAIEAFGWDMLLVAASDKKRWEKVLESIFRLSLHHYKAWAQTPAQVFICHDDMVWSSGAFMHPDFYRAVIFPFYQELWNVIRESGKRVLFCCDGDYTEFVRDLAEAGADGFIFEPMVDLNHVVEDFGKTHVIVGSKVDCCTLTFGTKDQIKAEIDATLELAFDCPGFMFAVGNHIASNVPLENALFYFDYLSRNWSR